VVGGGYVNTELRQLREPRLFDFVDYVTLDDGERRCWRCSSTCASRRAAAPHLRARRRRRVVAQTPTTSCTTCRHR
jgi:hypothetical protein